MSAPKKESDVMQLKARLNTANSAILTDFRGLSVADMTALRNLLRKSQVDYQVIKNRLARIAIKDTSFSGLDTLFIGPTAVALSYGDPVISSKLLSQFLRSATNLDIKGGVIEGRLYRKEEILVIAELPGRDILISQVVGTIAFPLTGFMRALGGPLSQLLGALSSIKAQKEERGS